METITIPKKLAQKGKLVVISQQEYNELLKAKKVKEFYTELDKDLDKTIDSYKKGKIYGPFISIKESRRFFESNRKKNK